MILMAMAAMFGIGGASIISRSLGAGEQKHADKVFHQVIWLVLISSIFIAIVTFIFLVSAYYAFRGTGRYS